MKWIDKELPKIEYIHAKFIWNGSNKCWVFQWKDGSFYDLFILPRSKMENRYNAGQNSRRVIFIIE